MNTFDQALAYAYGFIDAIDHMAASRAHYVELIDETVTRYGDWAIEFEAEMPDSPTDSLKVIGYFAQKGSNTVKSVLLTRVNT